MYEVALAHRKTLEWEGHRVVCNDDAMAGVLQATVNMSPALVALPPDLGVAAGQSDCWTLN
jgi:hypothetical protein